MVFSESALGKSGQIHIQCHPIRNITIRKHTTFPDLGKPLCGGIPLRTDRRSDIIYTCHLHTQDILNRPVQPVAGHKHNHAHSNGEHGDPVTLLVAFLVQSGKIQGKAKPMPGSAYFVPDLFLLLGFAELSRLHGIHLCRPHGRGVRRDQNGPQGNQHGKQHNGRIQVKLHTGQVFHRCFRAKIFHAGTEMLQISVPQQAGTPHA